MVKKRSADAATAVAGGIAVELPPPFPTRKGISRGLLWMRLALALVSAMPVVACTSSTRTTESTGEYIDDAAITSKVKAALLNDAGLKSFDIGVETYKRVVQLSGFVNTDQEKARAADVAATVSGVRSVKNNLIIK